MIRIKLSRPLPLRKVAIPITLTAVVTLVLAANSAIAQQGPPVAPGPPVTVAAPTPIAAPIVPAEPLSQIFACQESHCGHVIDLLIRNRLRQQTGTFGAELAPGLVLSAPPAFPQPGDLELLNVSLVSDGTPAQGPVIQLDIRNNSAVAVGCFQISVAGVLGQIHAHSPTIRGTVSQIGAGCVSQFQLQLPASAMALSLSGQQPVPFDTLVVAIDSFDELLEANELNNVRIIRRVELLPVAVVSPVSGIPEVASPAVSPALPDVPATTPPADTAIPSPEQPASPLDSFMLDDGQLETTQPTAAGMVEHFRGTTL
jgi:hypothetical protein